jgi:hypothetical protein
VSSLPPKATWRPLYEPDDGVQLRRAFEEVIGQLAELLDDPAPTSHRARVLGTRSLASGLGGPLLLAVQLAAAPGRADSDAWRDRAYRLLERLLERSAASQLPPSLSEGLEGVAWVVVHAARALGEDDPEELVADVDEGVAGYLEAMPEPWPESHDLLHGLTGFGVSALDRLASPAARRTVAGAVRHLDVAAEREGLSGPGATWRSYAPAQPDGFHQVGVAHGQAGVIAFLGRTAAAARRGELPAATGERAEALLVEALAWLFAQRLPDGSGSAFPGSVVATLPPSPTRLAWCYGDVGISLALLVAADALEDAALRATALEIATLAARRSAEEAQADDACLCHGTAGLGHQFHRLYRATGDDLYAAAARHWVGETLNIRQTGPGAQGVAGFPVWTSTDGQVVWRDDAGFLIGTTGVALCLAAALDPVEPGWDRVLGMSG